MTGWFDSSVFGAAVVFGFRHGFDWDHIAALTDLTGSYQSRHRSMMLATLYALGHAAMVLGLGVVAIVFAPRLPTSVDIVMERFVGTTLLALGVYIAWSAITRPGLLPARSRWMLLLSALERVTGRWRGRSAPVVIEHSHPHDHQQRQQTHQHSGVVLGEDRPGTAGAEVTVAHSHTHQHVAVMPGDPFMTYSNWSSLGIGLLHGVGAETPTQVLILAASTDIGGTPASLGLLMCFIVGVLGANTLIAAASTFGFSGLARRPSLMLGLSVLAAAFSLTVGTLLVLGLGTDLPVVLGA